MSMCAKRFATRLTPVNHIESICHVERETDAACETCRVDGNKTARMLAAATSKWCDHHASTHTHVRVRLLEQMLPPYWTRGSEDRPSANLHRWYLVDKFTTGL